MKKLTAITLAAVLALGVAACGGTGAGGNSATDDTQGKTPVDILNDVWADYEEDEKFAITGGDYENMVSDAPGTFGVTDGEVLDQLFGFPADSTALIDDGASMMHMMNQNTFTAAVYHVTDAKDVQTLADALKENIMGRQWICGFPDELAIYSVGEQYVVAAFGAEEAIDSFDESLETVYQSTKTLYEEDLRF